MKARRKSQGIDKGPPPEEYRCTGTSKRSGMRCANWSMRGETVCAIHGGKTPHGDALPQTKHGRYSKVLPTDLSALAEKIGRDKELLDLSDEIETLDKRAAQILSSIDSDESMNAWSDLKRAVKDLRKAEMSGDTRMLNRALVEIMSAVDEGQKLPAAWDELLRIFEARRRLVETEDRRRDRIAESVKVERLVLFMRMLAQSVKANVKDEKAVAAIFRDMERFFGEVKK